MSQRPEDLVDDGFVDAAELGSDGTAEYAQGGVVAVASGVIEVSGVYLQDPFTAPEAHDTVIIAGNVAADGTYTVATVVDNSHLTVNEVIADGAGGTASFRHPAGALAVGVDPTNLTQTIKNWLQGVLEDLDAAISGGGITENQHRSLLQLIHFISEGPAEGFATGATKTVTGTVFPTQELWKRADATKLVEKNITWIGVNATTIEWKIYAADGITVLATVTDTITYSGVFETGRTRAIA